MPIHRRIFQVAVHVSLAFSGLAGCTDSSAAPTSTADAGADAEATDASDAPVCSANLVTSVRGNVVDEVGDPLIGARVQPCIVRGDDAWLCLAPTDAESTGSFERTFDGANTCMKKLAMRVIGPLDETPRYSIAYCQADVATREDVDVGTVHLVPVLPPTDVVGDEAHYASGLVMTVGDADGEPSALLASVDGPTIGCGALREAAVAIVSFAPEGIRDATRITRIPVPASVADGTNLDIFVLGGLATYRADGTRVDEGELDRIGTATATSGFLDVDIPLLYANALVLKPSL